MKKKLVPETLNESMKVSEAYDNGGRRMSAAQIARMDAERDGNGKKVAFDTDYDFGGREEKYYDPSSTRGDLAAVGKDGRYREDSEGNVEVSQEQVDAAWAFVEKKQELVDRALKAKAPTNIIMKRKKYLDDAIAKAEQLESLL